MPTSPQLTITTKSRRDEVCFLQSGAVVKGPLSTDLKNKL